MDDARRAAERAARESYGRLIAMLASRNGDIAGAEDALGDAFSAAVASWPVRGVPNNPDAWLLTAARRNQGHVRARRATAAAGEATIMLLDDERGAAKPVPFGDDRLKLMFVCAHPAIATDVQPALMLQTVLGLDATTIAESFLIAPATMAQKLVRAKTKIRDARIAFSVPAGEALPARTAAVLAAIYAAYGTGWEDVTGTDPKRHGLADEAIWLARLVCDLLPAEPEAMGLLALMLHCQARHGARRSAEGAFVPLHRQDVKRWSGPAIAEAEALLRAAARHRTPGRFQTEAAIQSVHAQMAMTGENLRASLVALYDLLFSLSPSTGVAVARAVATGEAGRPGEALTQLEAMAGCASYQPWWAARARLLYLAGEADAAIGAAARAAALSSDPAIKTFLLGGGLFAAAPSA